MRWGNLHATFVGVCVCVCVCVFVFVFVFGVMHHTIASILQDVFFLLICFGHP